MTVHYDVSMVKPNEWVIGVVFRAEYTARVNSADEYSAIEAAKRQRRRQCGDRFRKHSANIDETWQYCTPDELVPYSRPVAVIMGSKFYVGGACGRHPLNHIRYTSSKVCAICGAEYQLGVA